jgi:hypothetical protein
MLQMLDTKMSGNGDLVLQSREQALNHASHLITCEKNFELSSHMQELGKVQHAAFCYDM